MFHDQEEIEIGTRASREDIFSAIGIQNISNFEDASVAQKMSWASKRQTTREEDIAYYLIGLLEVNVPALYGEGKMLSGDYSLKS